MKKVFEWLKEGSGRRSVQLNVIHGGQKFEAIALEGSNIIAKGESANGDAALISMAVLLMSLPK